MTDKLGEIGNVLSGIHEAVKTAKSLREKNSELYRVIEETKKQANEIDKLNIPDEPLLQELKETALKVRDSGSKLEVWLRTFLNEVITFDNFVKAEIKGSNIPQEIMGEFREILRKFHKMGNDFSDAFEKFITHLSKAQEVATKLTDSLKQKEKKMQEQADSKKTKGIVGTAGLAVAGAGLVALGFFTGGVAWVAAGAIGGTACGIGAAACGVKTVTSVKEMRKLASGILTDANKLDVLSKNLKSSCDKAGEIKLDKASMEALQTALEFFRRDEEKDETIAVQSIELSEKDAEIAELKAKLHSLGH